MSSTPLPALDEATRPRIDPYAPTPAEQAAGSHLRQIHDAYRQGLDQVAAVVDTAVAATADAVDVPVDRLPAWLAQQAEQHAAAIRAAIHGVGLQQAYQRLGSFCGQLCRAVEAHHRIEDAFLYPALRAADADRLGDVLDRLVDEHEVVHDLLEALDEDVRAFARDPARLPDVDRTFRHLRAVLESHFGYEEEQIGDALGVHRIGV